MQISYKKQIHSYQIIQRISFSFDNNWVLAFLTPQQKLLILNFTLISIIRLKEISHGIYMMLNERGMEIIAPEKSKGPRLTEFSVRLPHLNH